MRFKDMLKYDIDLYKQEKHEYNTIKNRIEQLKWWREKIKNIGSTEKTAVYPDDRGIYGIFIDNDKLVNFINQNINELNKKVLEIENSLILKNNEKG